MLRCFVQRCVWVQFGCGTIVVSERIIIIIQLRSMFVAG